MIQLRKGFTLIELIIVIAVVGILATIVFIAINPLGIINSANLAKAKTFSARVEHLLSISQVGKWSFEETSSPSKDTSGYNNDGTWNGGVISKTTEECGLGYGRCIEFDALGEYIDAGNNSILNMGINGFTVTFWMKHSGVTNTSHDTVIGKKGSGWSDRGWLFRTPNSSSLIFHLANQTTYAERAISIKANEWYHVVAVRNGNLIFLYGTEN